MHRFKEPIDRPNCQYRNTCLLLLVQIELRLVFISGAQENACCLAISLAQLRPSLGSGNLGPTTTHDCRWPLRCRMFRWACSQLLIPELGSMQLLPSLLDHPMFAHNVA